MISTFTPVQRAPLFLITLLSVLLLNGCATGSPTRKPVPIEDIHQSTQPTASTHSTATTATPSTYSPQTSEPVMPAVRPNEPSPHLRNPAVASLLNSAAQARAAQDYAKAQALAERAQAMAPQEARTYLELSRIYAQRGDAVQAQQMARRGLSVVHDDPATEFDLQQLSAP